MQAAEATQSDGHAAVHAWLVFCFADNQLVLCLDKLSSSEALALAAVYGYAQVAPDDCAPERESDAYLETRDGSGSFQVVSGTFEFKSWDWNASGPAQFVGPAAAEALDLFRAGLRRQEGPEGSSPPWRPRPTALENRNAAFPSGISI